MRVLPHAELNVKLLMGDLQHKGHGGIPKAFHKVDCRPLAGQISHFVNFLNSFLGGEIFIGGARQQVRENIGELNKGT